MIKNIKEFKRLYAQDKSILVEFFKWFTVTFLVCLIGVYLGLMGMINDGSLNELLADIAPALREQFMHIALGSYIFFTILVSAVVSLHFTIKVKK